MYIWTLITIGGMILLGTAIIYARSKNKAHDSAAEIARTDAAAHRARDATDRETDD
ncbi:MAG: hypothetical protein ABR601_04270 [Parasphingopyxis sp.]|nr:hypothetical protein [Sphingomonadales bacterium]